jgi:hypothetical protein
VRDLVNGLPDVTQGLLKRPGGKYISTLDTTSGGKWFTIYRDEEEQYVVQYKDGLFRVWSLLDGTIRPVNYTTVPSTGNDSVADGTPNPGLPICDNVELERTTQAYRVAKENVDSMRREINEQQSYLNRLINEINSVQQDKRLYDLKKTGKDTYEVIVAHIIQKIPGTSAATPRDFGKPVAPVGYKVVVGERRLKNATLKVPNTTGQNNNWQHFIAYGDAYEYKFEKLGVSEDPTVPVQNHINHLKTLLVGLEKALAQAREAYEQAAVPCGISSYPVALSNNNVPVVPDYLKDTAPEDLQFLTINDYTFISNRKRQVVMASDLSRNRPHEAFVSINTLAPNTQYSIDVAWTDDPTSSTVSRAAKLSVSPSSWKDNKDATTKYVDVQEFTTTNANGSDLRFTLETRGQQVPKSYKDASKGYYSEYTTTVTLVYGGHDWTVGESVTVTMAGKEYTVTVSEVNVDNIYSSASGGSPIEAITPSTGVISMSTLLNDLKTDIETKTFGITAQVVGNGLYIQHLTKPFTISTRATAYMTAFSNEIQNVSKLPLECVNGYVVKVVNSGEKEDDYYLEFQGKDGNNGVGVWVETIKPNIATNFSYSSMPHQLRRLKDGSFEFGPVDWESRLVGDNTSNPLPSFVGKSINKMFFFRNRLGFISDENVILSRAGDYFNFWSKTALTVQPSDPVDISASSTYPAILYDAVPFMNGVVLFSENQQFLLTTDQDVFGPETAKLTLTSTFRYSSELPAFNMGTTLGFINKGGRYARFMEVANINRQTPPELIEQSKIVSELIAGTVNCLADSKESDLVLLGTSPRYDYEDGKLLVEPSKHVFGYRYFNDGEKRVQSAWFKWDLTGDLEHHAILGDVYYSITSHSTPDGPKLFLNRHDLNPKVDSAYISDNSGLEYPVSLDNYKTVSPIGITFDLNTRKSHFTLPWHHSTQHRLVVFSVGNGTKQGWLSYPTPVEEKGKTICYMDGDWTDSILVVGYDYEMKVILPNLYLGQEDTTANRVTRDTRSSLRINRVKFRFGESGTFDTTVKRKGREDYTELWETRLSDAYVADTHSVSSERGLTIPIYEKNTNTIIELTSKHPTPATLFSMDWEGNYTPMFYKRV